MVEHKLERDVRGLQDELLILGGMAEKALLSALEAMESCDMEALQQLAVHCRGIDRKRSVVELGCLSLIAERRPRNGHLRSLVAMIEIANAMEAVGDCAQRLTSSRCIVSEASFGQHLAGVQRMATTVLDMLHRAMRALAGWDATEAQTVMAARRELDAWHARTRQELLKLEGRRDTAGQVTCLLRTAHSLSRSADHIIGMCEWIAYAASGTIQELPAGHAHPLPASTIFQPSSVAL